MSGAVKDKLLPLAGIVLLLCGVGSFVAAFATADWRWLLITAGCYVLIAAR